MNHASIWGITMATFVSDERCLPERVVERQSGLTPGVTVLGAISHPWFQPDNASPPVAKTIRVVCSVQHMQLLPWTAYSLDMSHIEHVWDLIGRRLARDPQLQKTIFFCAYKQYGILFHKQTFKIC
ncbi:UNVERIFIED_CONTAM: hypothetical protein NCL1_55402 [Trichonephila clavipes]